VNRHMIGIGNFLEQFGITDGSMMFDFRTGKRRSVRVLILLIVPCFFLFILFLGWNGFAKGMSE
jgi:hypothetical protein